MAKKACKRSSLEIYGGIYFVDDDKILEKKKRRNIVSLQSTSYPNSFLDVHPFIMIND
jgi:hypothetical protein